ncbi:MAG: FecR domain-containing protein [Myxococcaceae bacterium]|nr:FecR domain-containing protein [Myxococcaceae bacterium]
MIRHETERLWALAADELELDDRRYVELHLSDCPECRDALEAVELARRALESAKAASPSIDWLSTDEHVGSLVEKRMRVAARPRWVPFAFAGGLVAVAAGVTFVLWPSEAKTLEAPPSEPPLVQVSQPRPVRVELARGLTRVSARSEPVSAGETLKSGDVLRTGVAGKAFVHLPDSSHVRVAAATQVALTRAEADDVALTLSRGRVSVRASHEQRRAFVVHAGDVAVHVVGTIFSVENGAEGVEVAVAEGEVRVASGEGKEAAVKGGERLSIDPRGRTKLGRLTPGLERELSEVQGVAEAVTSAEQQVVTVAAKGGRAPAKQPGGLLPRLSTDEARARQVTLDEPAPVQAAPAPATTTVTVEPETQVEVEPLDGPGTAFPSLAGGYTRGVPYRNEVALDAPAPAPAAAPATSPKPEGPASDESEWAALPKAQPAPAPASAPPTLIVPMLEAKPAPVAAPTPAPLATKTSKSLEQVFLEKAEASLTQGGCERYLPGLEDIALESQGAAQQARILRARCFDAQLRPKQAMSEYAKYLEAYPKGRFADEARSALGQ